MNELTELLGKLNTYNYDLIVLTMINTDRVYCRFFKEGIYKDRMYITEPFIVAELYSICGEGEEIDASGIAKLKRKI